MPLSTPAEIFSATPLSDNGDAFKGIGLKELKRYATFEDSHSAAADGQYTKAPSIGNADDAAIEAAPIRARSKLRLATVLLALYFTLFISALNATIVATAIPTICSQLRSASGYSWIGGAYLLANAAAGPIWAKLSDIWGRKPILLSAVALWFVSSIVCALSHSMKMLLIGRTFQGVAGGGLIQLVNITISDLFSMRARTFYLGLLQIVWALAGGLGPILGGVLTQYASWRWIFWINLPITGLTFLLLLLFLDVHNPRTPVVAGLKVIDWFGSISITALVVMVLLGLDFGGATFPWDSPKVICLIAFGASMSLLFVFSEMRLAKAPIIPLRLFKNKSNVACLVVGFFHDFVYIAAEYYLPLFFQSIKGASPLISGVLILPITITEAVTGMITGMITHRTGRYVELIWIGTAVLTLGNGLYILLGAHTSTGEIVGLEFVSAIGAGMLFGPPLIALQAVVKQEDTSTATATLGLSRNIATALSVIVGGVVFQNGMEHQVPNIRASGLPSDLITKLSGSEAAANVNLIATITVASQKLAVREAYAWSLRNIWIVTTCASACACLASIFISKQILSTVHKETKTGLNTGPTSQQD